MTGEKTEEESGQQVSLISFRVGRTAANEILAKATYLSKQRCHEHQQGIAREFLRSE